MKYRDVFYDYGCHYLAGFAKDENGEIKVRLAIQSEPDETSLYSIKLNENGHLYLEGDFRVWE
ncbi:MAG: hypothetical protein MR906_05500 [Clostridium sp.]|nr:hypothetical protein [Clostridium sp.]